MRLAFFGTLSSMLSALVLINAWLERGAFFPAAIHVSRSGASVLVLLNWLLFVAIVLGRGLLRLFFGQLRVLEVEHLYERSWYAVTETCLAATMFRDELDLRFAGFFGLLIFVKVFHWVTEDRVDFMDHAPEPPSVFSHLRTAVLAFLLLSVDLAMLSYSIDVTLRKGPGMVMVFGFEYSILGVHIIASVIKYILHSVDLNRTEPWEDKSMYIFYLELFVDFSKLLSYSILLSLTVPSRGLPLHTIRDLYLTLRSFLRRAGDLLRYRRATSGMDSRYPNATAEEVERGGGVCVVCREEMIAAVETPGEAPVNSEAIPRTSESQARARRPKRLPCGHVFHFGCLKSWLERQQSCPTCRRSVLQEAPSPVPGTGDQVARAAPQLPAQQAQGGVQPPQAPGPVPPPQHPFPYNTHHFFNQQRRQDNNGSQTNPQQPAGQATTSTPPPASVGQEGHNGAQIGQNLLQDPYYLPSAPFPFAWPQALRVPALQQDQGNAAMYSDPGSGSSSNTTPEPTVPVLVPLFPVNWLSPGLESIHGVSIGNLAAHSAGTAPVLPPSSGGSGMQDPLEALTDTELEALEGRTRERIIARMKEAERLEIELSRWMLRSAQVVSMMGLPQGVRPEGHRSSNADGT
ncbi:hypothetical protein M427DRAFT_51675 [Gonapodya prolifera JEL478]|uniref:RING-type E3 ubiquitin transferase n=1 Tax=Gonapodya prolifera (strain JEL478) TaxID=1344416 RepID=A0A139AVT7_GONPJ|nr:hypothetical protein M427DRAFT_51675 [Gonapodya prolifera JEL478]|eukprot:KXS20693.1 hypothetical protein M427DRAFT_51675 [Gonapodya prolifera JEL478]